MFDPTLKQLIDLFGADWAAFLRVQLGLPTGNPVTLIDSNLSTFTPEADKVFQVGGAQPFLIHLELESDSRLGLPDRILKYNVLLTDKHQLPVRSVVMLLRKEALASDRTGLLERGIPGCPAYLEFHYGVVKLWELAVESLLTEGVGILPLVTLAKVDRAVIPGIIRRVDERYLREAPNRVEDLRTATKILMGLRFDEAFIDIVFQEVSKMKDSVVYQAILREGRTEGITEGRAEEARRILNLLGNQRFGPPAQAVQAVLDSITDVGRLERMTERFLKIGSWDELLAVP
jgi:hypothetical protein